MVLHACRVAVLRIRAQRDNVEVVPEGKEL
jgi:hypothetical protein